MSGQVWALVGVVVGSILGGGAQIVADALSSRRERRRWVDDHRRAAYLALLEAIENLTGAMQADSQSQRGSSDQMPETGPANAQFFMAMHPVRFYASPHVLALATDVENVLEGDAFFSLQEDDFPGFVGTLRRVVMPKIEALSHAMRTELGIVR